MNEATRIAGILGLTSSKGMVAPMRSAPLFVPSVVARREMNALVNMDHADSGRLRSLAGQDRLDAMPLRVGRWSPVSDRDDPADPVGSL